MKRNVLYLTMALAFVGIAAAVTGHHGLLAYLATGAVVFGTITVTQITTGDLPSNDRQSWTIVSTSDSDTSTGLISHVMGVNPLVTVEPIGLAAALAGWYRNALSSTQWAYQKSTLTGSGVTTATAEITLARRK